MVRVAEAYAHALENLSGMYTVRTEATRRGAAQGSFWLEPKATPGRFSVEVYAADDDAVRAQCWIRGITNGQSFGSVEAFDAAMRRWAEP